MITVSGILALLSAVLLGMGVLGDAVFAYASLATGLVSAALLPVGVLRQARRSSRK
ncbi:hypothetical protein [Frankia sp. Cj3]|uniref:hypothetical protein n=1 Tax=Frankia sp. Cj3 TaxID=2880976 RepID=UPI001EF6D4AB|nr:hypothetical protein [Frankia sp. Cj3]